MRGGSVQSLFGILDEEFFFVGVEIFNLLFDVTEGSFEMGLLAEPRRVGDLGPVETELTLPIFEGFADQLELGIALEYFKLGEFF